MFLEGHWRKEQDPELDPDLLVRGTDPDTYPNVIDAEHWYLKAKNLSIQLSNRKTHVTLLNKNTCSALFGLPPWSKMQEANRMSHANRKVHPYFATPSEKNQIFFQ